MPELKDYIYKRRSTRKFKNESVPDEILEKINNFLNEENSLVKDCKFSFEIVSNDDMSPIKSVVAPHYILLFGNEEDYGLYNIGFVIQKLDLFLHNLGLGTCWLGASSPSKDIKNSQNFPYAISFAFGYPKVDIDLSDRNFSKNRKPLSEISNESDERLEICRVCPSAMNSQPWYFISDDDFIYVYRKILSPITKKLLDKQNQIDIGIALANISIIYSDTFEFFETKEPKNVPTYQYIGAVKI